MDNGNQYGTRPFTIAVIHGDYDLHPAEGVQKPLASILYNFRFILLKNCGHKPWLERGAKEEFYRILEDELITEARCWLNYT